MCPITYHRLLHMTTATHPPGGMGHSARASAHRNAYMSEAGEQDRDSQVAGLSRRRASQQHHESTPQLQGRGPLAPQSPVPPPSCPYLLAPIGALADVSWQQRSAEARREHADLPAVDGSAEATGSLTRMLRTKPASFSLPGFLNLMCCTPFSRTCWEGCPERGGGIFLSFFS